MAKNQALLEWRRNLTEHLPWSPHDYVESISKKGDRELFAEKLTRDFPEEHDLRFEGDASDGGRVAVFAEVLPWDSDFFGFGVARLDAIFPISPPLFQPEMDYQKPLDKLVRAARRREIRYLLAMVDARDLALLRAIGEAGFALLETRYFQHGPIDEPELIERFPVRRATAEDIPSLAEAASHTVNPYDRFHADPFLPKEKVDRLMELWVEESVHGRMADVVIVPEVDKPKAFVTYRYHKISWKAWGLNMVQGVLSAVAPEFMGWMDKLAPEVNHHLRRVGGRYSFGSTQVTNRSVLWFAQEAGAKFGKCEHIFRKIL